MTNGTRRDSIERLSQFAYLVADGPPIQMKILFSIYLYFILKGNEKVNT